MTRHEEQTTHSVPSASAAERVAVGHAGTRDLDPCGDDEKREALVRLRDRYAEAQKLVSPGLPNEKR